MKDNLILKIKNILASLSQQLPTPNGNDGGRNIERILFEISELEWHKKLNYTKFMETMCKKYDVKKTIHVCYSDDYSHTKSEDKINNYYFMFLNTLFFLYAIHYRDLKYFNSAMKLLDGISKTDRTFHQSLNTISSLMLLHFEKLFLENNS